MKKRYQIFVSSTFEDLKEERGRVMETILNFDCFPAGMELFPAMDEQQFEYIKRIIDDSDYYLLIIGGRYGSVDKNGVSWTEKEYNYAASRGIPVMAFILNDEAYNNLPKKRIDNKRKKLADFKKKVSTDRLIQRWSNADDLALAVAKSLPIVKELQPGIGWVRADSIPSGDSQMEVDRLQKEIEKYLEEIERLVASVEGLKTSLKQKDAEYLALAMSYQTEQSETKKLQLRIEALKYQIKDKKGVIKNLEAQIKYRNERIKSLEAELEKYKDSTPALEKELQPLTEVFTVKGVSFKMVHVEGGTFMMGTNDDGEADTDEKPAHEVTLSDYWIGETQVTQALWQAVMGENPSRFKGVNHPVERVSWDDCQAFIKELNRLTGRKFSLPTEAKWEFAARGGNESKGFKYSGSNNINEVAWYDKNSKGKTHPVGEKSPNELGLYDMSGNVWEWCSDWFDGGYYSNSPTNNPVGSSNGSDRVRRGAGWGSSAGSCRVTRRYSRGPSGASFTLGLRLAL